MNLETRKKLAVPFYWAAGVWLTWANWVDGPQPRKPKKLKMPSVDPVTGCNRDRGE